MSQPEQPSSKKHINCRCNGGYECDQCANARINGQIAHLAPSLSRIEPQLDDETVIIRRMLGAAQARIMELERAAVRASDEPPVALNEHPECQDLAHSELMRKLPNVPPHLLADIQQLSPWALQRRVLIQADWLGSYSRCLDGLGLKEGVDTCWNPRDIRRAVENLRPSVPPSPALREIIQDMECECDPTVGMTCHACRALKLLDGLAEHGAWQPIGNEPRDTPLLCYWRPVSEGGCDATGVAVHSSIGYGWHKEHSHFDDLRTPSFWAPLLPRPTPTKSALCPCGSPMSEGAKYCSQHCMDRFAGETSEHHCDSAKPCDAPDAFDCRNARSGGCLCNCHDQH